MQVFDLKNEHTFSVGNEDFLGCQKFEHGNAWSVVLGGCWRLVETAYFSLVCVILGVYQSHAAACSAVRSGLVFAAVLKMLVV